MKSWAVSEAKELMVNHFRILLIDLDYTLVNHEFTLQSVAKELNKAFVATNERGALPGTVYLQVVQHWEIFYRAGAQDYRRDWLSPDLIAIVLALCERKVEPDLFPTWLQLLGEGQNLDPAAIGRFCQLLASKKLAMLAEKGLETSIRRLIARLMSQSDLFQLYPDVYPFFAAGQESSYTPYVVTDGNRRVQRNKFRRLGLGRWIPVRRVVTTDDLLHLPYLRNLSGLKKLIWRELALPGVRTAPLAESDVIEERLHLVGQLQYAIRGVNPLNRVSFLESLCRAVDTVILLLTITRSKVHTSFYPFLLNAISRNPLDPVQGFKALFNAPKIEPVSYQIAVMGDRYDTDIYPVTKIHQNGVFSIRLKRGKYIRDYPDSELLKQGMTPPSVRCASLSTAARYLQDEKVWMRLPILRPPSMLQDLMVDTEADLRLCCSFPEQSPLYKIARALLNR